MVREMQRRKDWLEGKGWKCVRPYAGFNAYRSRAALWEHPSHQPVDRGFFTMGQAEAHQRIVDRGNCDCVREETELRTVHCWETGEIAGERGSCMLLQGHAGPHEFVPNSEIGVKFTRVGH